MATDTTRPANIGGIDISGIDVAGAIFDATGGGYGAPQGSGGDDALLGAPDKTGDWVTQDGRTPDGTDPSDTFDFGSLVDPHRDIMLTTDDPDSDNPLLALMTPEEAPKFANGGPDGNADGGVLEIIAVVAVAVVIAAAVVYVVSDDGKKQIDSAAAEIRGAFDGLFTGGSDAAGGGAAGSGGTLQGFDTKSNNAWQKANQPGGSNYYSDPDADQTAPTDDSLVLSDLLHSLVGTTDIAALASDPQTFMSAVKTVMDGMMTGKVGALGDLMSRLGGGNDGAVDGLAASAMDRLVDQFGATEALDFIPFREDLEAPDFLLSVEAVRDAFTSADQDQQLTPPHDGWW